MSPAKATGTTQYLTCRMGEVIFALEIEKVREVLAYSAITNAPRMPAFMRGLIKRQGSVAPVVDLRPKFGLARLEKTENTCVIIVAVKVNKETMAIGVVTDEVPEVIDLGPDKLNPELMEGTTASHEYIQGKKKQGDILYSVLDIDKALSADEISLAFAFCEGASAASLDTGFRRSCCEDTPGGAKMDLNQMIVAAKTFDDLLDVLDVMAKEIYRMTDTKQLQAEEIQCMASRLTEIRLLLNELQRYEAGTPGLGRKMSSRYMELEGRVKEMRNDLDQAIKRVSH